MELYINGTLKCSVEQNLPEAKTHRFYKLGELLVFSSLIPLSFRVTFFWKVPNYLNYLTEYEKMNLGYILGPKKGVLNGPLGGAVYVDSEGRVADAGMVCPSLSSAHPRLRLSEISRKNVSWALILSHMRYSPEPGPVILCLFSSAMEP